MRFALWIPACLLMAGTPWLAGAQTSLPQVVKCDVTTLPRSAMRVQDEASGQGAVVEDVALVTLPNGMRAVQFSVRNAKAPEPFGTTLKVRYTVQWSDDCGRRIVNGSQVVDGVVLSPRQQRVIQSTALHPDATHAQLRIYVDN